MRGEEFRLKRKKRVRAEMHAGARKIRKSFFSTSPRSPYLHLGGVAGLGTAWRAESAEEVLDGSGKAMAEDGQALVAGVVDPVELHHAPVAVKWQMAVPGMIGAQESDERAAGGRDFGGKIVDVVLRAEQAQAAAGIVPLGIEVEQHGDDFAGGIAVDIAIASAAAAAGGDRSGAVREIDAEFVFEGLAELGRFEGVNEGLEAGAEFQRVEGKAAGLLDLRVIGIEPAKSLGGHKSRQNQVLVGFAHQWCGAKGIEIKDIADHEESFDNVPCAGSGVNPSPRWMSEGTNQSAGFTLSRAGEKFTLH